MLRRCRLFSWALGFAWFTLYTLLCPSRVDVYSKLVGKECHLICSYIVAEYILEVYGDMNMILALSRISFKQDGCFNVDTILKRSLLIFYPSGYFKHSKNWIGL